MWCDELPPGKSWSVLWSGYIICGRCSGIRRIESSCQACGEPPPSLEPRSVHLGDAQEVVVPAVFAGAEGRYEDWIYLQMLEREWKRPVLETDRFVGLPDGKRPSPQAAIVLLFWSYFETRIERLLRTSLRDVPTGLLEDSLRRHSSIGARLTHFYRAAFGKTYSEDLAETGYARVWPHLSRIQERRNAFVHGEPQAIDHALVVAVVEMLKVEHEAWIAVFNKRVARP